MGVGRAGRRGVAPGRIRAKEAIKVGSRRMRVVSIREKEWVRNLSRARAGARVAEAATRAATRVMKDTEDIDMP